MQKRILALLVFLLVAPILQAACRTPSVPSDHQRWTGNLYFENDLFEETDQNYTSGIRLSVVSPDLDSFRRDPRLDPWVVELNKQLAFLYGNRAQNECTTRRLVLTLGQTIYTPRTSSATQLLVDERPYAASLFGGVAYHLRTEDYLETLGVNVGIVGPLAFGQESQDFIHDLRGFDKFQGWDNQLDNEPSLQLLYEFKHKYADTGPALGADLIVHGGVSLGNVATYLNAGAEARIGWNIPDDFGTSAVRPGADNSAPGSGWQPAGPRDWGAHLFVASDARLVARDIFLDGNTFSNSHSVDKKHLVADIAAGISLHFRDLKFSFARTFRTKEFDQQLSNHYFGSLSLSWSRLF